MDRDRNISFGETKVVDVDQNNGNSKENPRKYDRKKVPRRSILKDNNNDI